MALKLPLLALLVLVTTSNVEGHARFVEPPSRASMWRFGFDTPKDWNDNQSFCGGIRHQHGPMEGKCGICGDPWDASPREHEVGGKFANGIIVRQYDIGQVMDVTINVTANHKGKFVIKLCVNNDVNNDPTQECFDKHVLKVLPEMKDHYELPSATYTGEFAFQVQLPEGIRCTQCIVQWTYTAGNNWGVCEDGSGAVGCGDQETFRSCADVAIGHNIANANKINKENAVDTDKKINKENAVDTDKKINKESNLDTDKKINIKSNKKVNKVMTTKNTKCVGVGPYARMIGINAWCQDNCGHNPSFCPSSHCKCFDQ